MKDCRNCKFFVSSCTNTKSNNYYDSSKEPTPHALLDLPDDEFFKALASECNHFADIRKMVATTNHQKIERIMKYSIGTATIEITKLEETSLHVPNYDEEGRRGENNTHKWVHVSGLGFMNPSWGVGTSVEDCLEQARKAYE